jgi:hypothetical protein
MPCWPNPDLPSNVTRLDVMRYGYAMSTPVPGIRSRAALLALQQNARAAAAAAVLTAIFRAT